MATWEDTENFERALSCLVESNQAQAKRALVLDATARGPCVHPMIGSDPEKARGVRGSEGARGAEGIAIGYEAADPALATNVRQLDAEVRPRRPIGEFVFGGRFGSVSKQFA